MCKLYSEVELLQLKKFAECRLCQVFHILSSMIIDKFPVFFHLATECMLISYTKYFILYYNELWMQLILLSDYKKLLFWYNMHKKDLYKYTWRRLVVNSPLIINFPFFVLRLISSALKSLISNWIENSGFPRGFYNSTNCIVSPYENGNIIATHQHFIWFSKTKENNIPLGLVKRLILLVCRILQ